MSISGYGWSDSSARFRDLRTGKFVPEATVRAEIDRFLDAASARADVATDALRAGQITLAEWQTTMAAEVKVTHLATSMIANGGKAQMTQSAYGQVGATVREQYGYLQHFAEEIASGKQKLDGTLRRRARLYTQAARTTFEGIKRRVNQIRGYVEHRSIRHAKDSCTECIALEQQGWTPITEPIPLPGQRLCRQNCKCQIAYRRAA